MLFCSLQFLQFFLVIFTAYWLMRWRCGRAGILLTVGSVFVPTTWNYLCGRLGLAASLPDLCDYVALALSTKENPVAAGGIYWMTALLCASTLRALGGNHDRARVWLLLCASFFFYASWSKWLALVICVSTAMDYLIARGLDAFSSPRLTPRSLTCQIMSLTVVALCRARLSEANRSTTH